MDNQGKETPSGFKGFAFKRFIIAVILIVLIVWALSVGPGMMHSSKRSGPLSDDHPKHVTVESARPSAPAESRHAETAQTANVTPQTPSQSHAPADDAVKQPHADSVKAVPPSPQKQPNPQAMEGSAHPTASSDQPAAAAAETAVPHADKEKPASSAPEEAHTQAQSHEPTHEAVHVERATGVLFVEAVMQPLHHELSERFWGWRPNDIVNLTDNINHFQRGVLEVSRRSVVLLSERISRTGTTDAFNLHLENAMNWLMVKADRYWFPAPESKYKESLKELERYKQALADGQASFYTRTDNIIPLLASYEDLLGSCDENLVKQKEADGARVSFFHADDFFYYAQGVASTMAGILEAIHHEFSPVLKSRNAEELLHHAILSCRQAADLNPLLITNGDLDGILANHRAHLAAPISHARFYIGLLIKTLST